MHMRQISLATVGFIVSIFLIFSGFTLSASRVTPINFGPPVAHAGEVLKVIVAVVAVVAVAAIAIEFGVVDFEMFGVSEAFLETEGIMTYTSTLGFEASTAAGAFALEQAVTSLVECAVGLICGSDDGKSGSTYSVAAGAVSGDVCYGPLNACGKAYKGTYEQDPDTGQMGCKIGDSFTYGAPSDSECTGPDIEYFRIKNDAGAGTIDAGQSVTLEWKSPGASYCKWTGATKNFKVAASGEFTIDNITQTSTYQIDCADASDNYGLSKFVTLTVLEPQVTLSAEPLRVKSGDITTVTWNGRDVKSCVVSDLAGNTIASGEAVKHQFSNGSPISPKITTQNVFKIVCQTNGEPITKSVIVNVVPNYEEF